MLSNFTIGLLLGVGFGGWVYSKTMRHNGGQAQQALLVAAVAGVIGTIIMTTVLSLLFHKS